MKRWIAYTGLLMLLATAVASADQLPPSADQAVPSLTRCVQTMLQAASEFSMTFEQSQYLAVLTSPLVSHGRVSAQTDGEIIWQVNEPLDYSLMIEADGTVTASDGTSLDHPAIMRLVRMLLTMDTAALAATFSIEGQCDAHGWSMRLTPDDELMAGLFSHIEASGGSLLSAVNLVARSGDRTVITFRNVESISTLPTD